MKTPTQIATEAIGFAPKTFTDAEWKIEAARMREAKAARSGGHIWSTHDGVRYCPRCGQEASRMFLRPCKHNQEISDG